MRIFVGIDFSEALKKDIYSLQQKLKPLSHKGSWKYEDNFHLTLKFLGDMAEDRLDALYEAIDSSRLSVEPFDIALKGVGAFGLSDVSPETGLCPAKVLWLGVEGDLKRLNTLYQSVEDALVKAGFSRDIRPYAPHITLGQDLKFNCEFQAIRNAISELDGRIHVTEITVFNSEVFEGRRVYRPLRKYPIGSN